MKEWITIALIASAALSTYAQDEQDEAVPVQTKGAAAVEQPTAQAPIIEPAVQADAE